jgi:hypothetical protein
MFNSSMYPFRSCQFEFLLGAFSNDSVITDASCMLSRCIRLAMVFPKYLKAVGIADRAGQVQKIL